MELTGKIARPQRSTGTAPRLLGAALLVCLLCLLGSSPASAAPAWLPATDLSAPLQSASNADVAMDAAGNSIAVWERNSVVQASVRPAGGGFSAPVNLSSAANNPEVAMTPAGDAIVVWRHFDVNSGKEIIQASTRPPGGGFSAPGNVGSVDGSFSFNVQVSINAAGDAAVVWQRKEGSNFVVQAATRPAGGSFADPIDISDPAHNAANPQVAVDPTGNAVVVWGDHDSSDPANPTVVQESSGSGSSFSPPSLLSTVTAYGVTPDVAVDAAGDAVVVWEGYDVAAPGPPPTFTPGVIQATIRPGGGGSFSSPVNLSDSSQSASSPQIAMTPTGDATVVWARLDTGGYSIVQASTSPPGGSFSTPVDLSATGQNAFNPVVAVNAAGAATVAWKRSDGANDIVQASTRPAGGDFSPAIDLSAAGQDAVFPEVAMDGAGDATAVWWRGTNSIVQAAGYDADAPQLRNLSIPSSGMVGVPVSFSVNPFDVWPIASTAFDFGDGASAPGASVSHTYAAKGTYRVTASSQDAAGTPVAAGGTISIFPSNDFAIGRLSLSRKKGIGTFAVAVPGPGKLVLSGKWVKKATKRVGGAGGVKLPIRARGKALKRLKKRGKVRVALSISFTPDGGTTLVKFKKVTLIENLRH